MKEKDFYEIDTGFNNAKSVFDRQGDFYVFNEESNLMKYKMDDDKSYIELEWERKLLIGFD